MFRFYLNNTLVSDPLNWDDFSETIERDDSIKGLLPKYDVKLTFNAGGYDLLYTLLGTEGFCNLVELKVDYQCSSNEPYTTVLRGYIFISDCKFNLNKCTVDCAVLDNNFGARIFNNKNIKAQLNVARSKNDIAITAATATTVGVSSTANVFLFNREMYSVKEAFRFLIEFMTDGTVGFESDYLTEGVVTETAGWLYLVLGEELRLGNNTAPTISFQELFQEVNKKYPISFTMISVAGVPTVKIENDSYFFNSTSSIQINNIDNLQQSFNNELLYSIVKLGSPAAEYAPAYGSFPIIRYLSFSEEEYFIKGECNIDKTLDLSGVFVSDSNIVQRIVSTDTSNDVYDTDTIFIESRFGAAAELTNDPITDTQPLYYNANLTNKEVAERYSLQNSLGALLGSNNEEFMATKTSTQNFLPATPSTNWISPAILFQDDFTPPNFDTALTYNPANGRYTSLYDGVYSFEAQIKFYIDQTIILDGFGNGPSSILYQYCVAFKLYDSGNNLISTTYSYNPNDPFFLGYYNLDLTGTASVTVTGNADINVITGYYVTANLFMLSLNDTAATLNSFYSDLGSYFKTTAIVNGGGYYANKVPENYFVSKFEFEQPLSNDAYNTLKLDLSKAIDFNHKPLTNKKGWIRKMTRKYSTSETTWELISNITNSN